MELAVGTVVAGYTIEGVLGAGGMGTVYRAKHPSLPRSDALKILSAELSRDKEFRERFAREADIAGSLDHPNIVTIHDRGETEDGRLWIAMQYVQGSDADKEALAGRMPARRAVHIITEVAKALDYAHRRRVLHRDIKPANFLLAPNDERILLGDFGIARLFDDTGLTQTNAVMASVAYAAPEAFGDGPVDHRADIYSLGCALFRMLTKKAPFSQPDKGIAATITGHLSHPVPRVSTLVTGIPPAFDEVIGKAMAKEPDARYQSAGEMAAAAARALEQRGPEEAGLAGQTLEWTATPPQPQPPLPTTPPQFNGPAPVIDDSVITYPSGHFSGPRPFTLPGGATPPQFPPAPPDSSTGPQVRGPRRRRRAMMVAAIAMTVVLAAGAGLWLWRSANGEAYQAQSLTHMHGTTELTSAPHAVAALGPDDGDAVRSRGVQPVALTAPRGELPGWARSALTGTPTVMSSIDTTAVAAAEPDLIIATGDIDPVTYERLRAIAPTITRPQNSGSGWTWQSQQTWDGRILGRETKASELLGTLQSVQADLRNQHPQFAGKSIGAVSISDDEVSEILTPSFTAEYLESLGFRYSQRLQRNPVDGQSTTRPIADPNELYRIESDALVVVRTDQGAGWGGYDGLPKQLTAYTGAMVIVDQPDVIAALGQPGGYLAARYLDDNFVAALARDIK
ncbi:serine/threonine-protein kinase [Mycobacterium hubeiense]|uniref:serine/threonine-protein kinase n=1 Tax=Mycobacterium hubeiense TaxID=1867256 RepID=UPI000C7E9A15|nr:protein kinase [Mycobacterium sp. QGD 101]